VSIVSNIVEGSARNSETDFLHFPDIAYGSAREVEYQIGLARRLSYLSPDDFDSLKTKCEEASKVLNGLIRSLRKF
jgi:four helix bundle protein